MKHTCKAIIITCFDFRFQEYIHNFIKEKFGTKKHDRVAWAGGVKDFDNVLNQIKISKRLHDIKTVILVNHEDCGAYGPEGHIDRHVEDLKKATEKINSQIPDLEIETYYLKLDGTFESVI